MNGKNKISNSLHVSPVNSSFQYRDISREEILGCDSTNTEGSNPATVAQRLMGETSSQRVSCLNPCCGSVLVRENPVFCIPHSTSAINGYQHRGEQSSQCSSGVDAWDFQSESLVLESLMLRCAHGGNTVLCIPLHNEFQHVWE